MVLKTIATATLILAGTSAFAGSPANPGAGGQSVKDALELSYSSPDNTLGQAVKELQLTQEDYKLADEIMFLMEQNGGVPTRGQ